MTITTWPHYQVINTKGSQEGWEILKGCFPDGEANEMNFCLFSTSGVHGSYATIEDIEQDLEDTSIERPLSLTFLIVHPRLVCLKYGNIDVSTPEEINFLKTLRQSSWNAMQTIGRYPS